MGFLFFSFLGAQLLYDVLYNAQFCKNLRYNSDIKTSPTLSDVTGTLGEIEGALNVFLSLSFGLGCRYSSLFLLGES